MIAHFLGRKDNAYAQIEKTLEGGGLNLTEMDRLGDICVDLGQNAKALEIYKTILAEVPDNSEVQDKIAALEKGTPAASFALRARGLSGPGEGAALALFDMGGVLFRETATTAPGSSPRWRCSSSRTWIRPACCWRMWPPVTTALTNPCGITWPSATAR